jgi:hypothetical protein
LSGTADEHGLEEHLEEDASSEWDMTSIAGDGQLRLYYTFSVSGTHGTACSQYRKLIDEQLISLAGASALL